jgi:hypothetical protein
MWTMPKQRYTPEEIIRKWRSIVRPSIVVYNDKKLSFSPYTTVPK